MFDRRIRARHIGKLGLRLGHLHSAGALFRVVKVFARGVITRDFAMFLPAGKNTFGHGNKWQKLNFGNGWVLSAVF